MEISFVFVIKDALHMHSQPLHSQFESIRILVLRDIKKM